jgi:hypothetical protein
MAIVREGAEIVDMRFDKFRFARAPHDSVIERAGEELWEYGDDVESH